MFVVKSQFAKAEVALGMFPHRGRAVLNWHATQVILSLQDPSKVSCMVLN